MRVILKPAGAIMVTATVSVLTVLALTQSSKKAVVIPTTPSPSDTVSTPKPVSEATRAVLVNMDSVGGQDWAIWRDNQNPVRKATGNHTIGDLVVVGGHAYPYDSPLRGFSWSNGKSPARGSNEHSGLQMGGPGNGFRCTVSASSRETHIVRLYVGGYRAGALFSAKLSDGSDPASVEMSEVTDPGGHFARLYTIHFKARQKSDKLNLSWTMGGGNGDGFITLQAIATE